MRSTRTSRVRFQGEILAGHKGCAVEVPFDPAARWKIVARALKPGRRGHAVRGTLGGIRFESSIVPRSRRFWMLVSDELACAAHASVGDVVTVVVEPAIDGTAKVTARAAKPRTSKKPNRRAP